MSKEALISISIIAVYMISVNLYVRHRSKLESAGDVDGFAVGGRSFPWYMVMFTILATWYTGSCFTGGFGYAVSFGVVALYDTTQVVIGLVFLYVFGPKIWKWGKIYNLYNLPDFIRLRYNDKKLAIVVTVFTIAIGFPWNMMAFKTFGILIHSLTYNAIPVNVGIVLSVVFILSYSLRGGQKSVVTSDFIQGLVMIFGSLGVIFFLANKLFGGFGPMFQQVAAKTPELLTVPDASYWSSIILAGIFGSFCWMEIFNRMFVARSPRELKISTAGAPILGSSMYIALLLLGVGCSLIPAVAADPESGFLTISAMTGGPVLLGFVGIIVLAAEVSSADSGLVTGGFVIADALIKPFNPKLTDEQLIKYSRIIVICIASLSGFLAMFEIPMLQKIAIFTFEYIVNVFPIDIIGLLWKRGNSKAAWSGFAVGVIVTTLLKIFPVFAAAHFGSWAPGILGLFCNIIVYVAVSLLSKPDPRVNELFDSVKNASFETA